jgi:flagellin-like hook-associated protein FlgL
MVNLLHRIHELILKRSNSFFSDEDRAIIDSEINLHYQGILKNISWAQFNTKPLFIDWMEDEEVQNRFKESAFYTLKGVDRILNSVLQELARQGALENILELRNKAQALEQENATEFLSQGDTNFATEISRLMRYEILFFSDLFLLKMEN